MRHEHIEVPENQRMSCLKFILKKEIQSWDGGKTEKNDNEDDENDGSNDIENKKIRLLDNDSDNINENEIVGKEIEIEKEKLIDETIETVQEKKILEKTETKEVKKSPLKRLLMKKEEKERKREVRQKEEKDEMIILKESNEEIIVKNIPTEDSTESKSPFPSHFSAFPSTSASSPLFRPFQAVIFADDEQLAVTVCDTVRALLSQKGPYCTNFDKCFFLIVIFLNILQFLKR